MPWESFKSLAPLSVKKAGFEGALKAQNVLETASRVLVARWGDEKASVVEIRTFKNGVLDMSFSSPAAMQTLRAEKKAFLNALNNALNERLVLDIKFSRKDF